jgi:endonuclease/exonuclease/phosphatase family metal-dependent hydrolase
MRLLSYNIHKGVGGRDRRYRLDRVLEVIRAMEADLVCLQEVDWNVQRSRWHDQPALFREGLGAADHLYQLNVPHRDGGYGNLFLSRWPVVIRDHLCLRFRRRKPRGAQLAVVETPQGPLHVVNVHLGLSGKERRWLARHVLAHPTFLEKAHLPTLIAGDYNDWRNNLGRHCFHHHEFRQVTAPTAHFRSFPAFLAVAALDKIYCRGTFHAMEARVVKNRLTRRASDHLPLLVDFHLTAGQVIQE